MDLFVLKTWIQAKFNMGDERGASMVEYGLLLALIAVIAIVAVKALGTGVSSKFNDVKNSLSSNSGLWITESRPAPIHGAGLGAFPPDSVSESESTWTSRPWCCSTCSGCEPGCSRSGGPISWSTG